jgi:transcriptional regulator with GAF, ATPase, and Fis domain
MVPFYAVRDGKQQISNEYAGCTFAAQAPDLQKAATRDTRRHRRPLSPPMTTAMSDLTPASAIVVGPTETGEPFIIASSGPMREICALARRVAAGDAKVLVTGESGVGKDLVARLVHAHSPRATREFVAVNCAGVAETLLESELFGHVKGAFTDAVRDKIGKLQLADGGTLFLDEVGEMSLRMQAMFLRFLENGEIQPVGADRGSTRVNVRVIAATNKSLSEEVAAGRFREDLLYRLDVVHIHVPPLRERREDVRALVGHLALKAQRQIAFTEAALAALEAYRWPGNVRELQNVVERLLWMSPGDQIDLGDLPVQFRPGRVEYVVPARERRRQRADNLFRALVDRQLAFWEHVHSLFLDRDLTRHDIRELVRRGLAATHGNYRGVVRLFGMDDADYKKFMNFLTTHDCVVDFRLYRNPVSNAPAAHERVRAAVDIPSPRRRPR